MDEYMTEREYALDKVWLDFLGQHYVGHGALIWRPKSGFHLEALFRQVTGTATGSFQLSGPRIFRKDEKATIRMLLEEHNWAIAPNVVLAYNIELKNNKLSADFNRVVFARPSIHPNSLSPQLGSCLFQVKPGHLHLSDGVSTEVRVDGEMVHESVSRSGISFKDETGEILTGYLIENGLLKLTWVVRDSKGNRCLLWEQMEAARHSVSMLTGQTVGLLQREMHRNSRHYIDRRGMGDVRSLRPFLLFGEYIFTKETFVELTRFLARDDLKARICRAIFDQVSTASGGISLQGSEFLISTTLDAALRTLDGEPFREGDRDTWDISNSLISFRQRYLSDDWIEDCDRVLRARKRLRHRTAHPEWLYLQGNSLTEERLSRSLKDRMFLCRFYGCMILALLGKQQPDPIHLYRVA